METFLNDRISTAFLYRNYSRGYMAPLSSAFSESTSTSNEEAFYSGIVLYPAGSLKISAYADLFRFPWLKYRVSAPSSGHDYFVQADYRFSENWTMYVRFKKEMKPQDGNSIDAAIATPVETCIQKLRFHSSYKISEALTLRSRMENVWYRKEDLNETGFLIYQDLIYSFRKLPLHVSVRYALFDTDGFNSRIYTYENNVLYAFSIPAFQDLGTRYYLLAKYSPKKWVDLWFRAAQAYYPHNSQTGSGNEMITGHEKTEFVSQVRIRF